MRTTTKKVLPIVKPLLRTPISYYGGKQSMLKEILPRIPQHRIYTEVFFGGGAVFWAQKNGWYSIEIDKPLGVALARGTTRKRKIEVLTANVPSIAEGGN